MRPLCCLRNFVRFGCSICHSSLATAACTARCRTVLKFLSLAVTRGRVVIHDLAFEDPGLDPDDTIGSHRLDMRVIDVGTQRMQRHAAFTSPFGPGDLGAAKAAGEVHADTQGTHAHGVLHGPFHRTAEANPTLELLGDALTHQCGVQFGLAHFNDVEVQFALGHRGQFLAQGFDVCAFLADDDAGARCVDCHPAFLVRALDDHAAYAGLLALFLDELAHGEIFKQQVSVVFGVSIPAAVPGAVDLDAHANRIDFITHQACSS